MLIGVFVWKIAVVSRYASLGARAPVSVRLFLCVCMYVCVNRGLAIAVTVVAVAVSVALVFTRQPACLAGRRLRHRETALEKD